jgi:Asp-tRNA(Asn)/Glu-tRNA(Gln) amidotransferase A subunit family amidase
MHHRYRTPLLSGGIALLCYVGAALLQTRTDIAPLSRETVRQAELLTDLRFTDAKRDSMLEGLEEQRVNYRRLRGVPLPNEVSPALVFNPIPPDFKFPGGSAGVQITPRPAPVLPPNIEDLAYASVGELSALIRSRKVTSVQLTELFLRRLKKYGSTLQCVITLTEERALREAERADREIARGIYRGPLHGIPYGAKDLLATRGIATTWGSVPFRSQIFDYDATVVRKLEEAGAVLVAKLTMGELAWGDVWFGGRTRNPWDLEQGSSGSSAGPAAATAAGLVPFAIGTETWGSIVSPAARCGVTGLRPTYGRVSRFGAMALSWSMDKIGPICRSVEDCAVTLNAIYGPDGRDQTVFDVPFSYTPSVDLSRLRIGYVRTSFDSAGANDRAVLDVYRKLGAEMVPIELPRLPINDCSIILSAEAAAAFDDLTRSGKDDLLVRQIKQAWPNAFRTARMIPAVEYIQANRVRTLLIREMQDLMRTVDCYLAPADDDNLLLTNLTGHPSVVMPDGFSDKGRPTGITLTGRLFDEGLLLAVAKKYQDATGYQMKHPPLFP